MSRIESFGVEDRRGGEAKALCPEEVLVAVDEADRGSTGECLTTCAQIVGMEYRPCVEEGEKHCARCWYCGVKSGSNSRRWDRYESHAAGAPCLYSFLQSIVAALKDHEHVRWSDRLCLHAL